MVDSGIYKISVNGTESQKISEMNASFLYVQDDALYVHGSAKEFNSKIYTMDINGNNERVLFDTPVSSFYVHDGFIYYEERERMSTDRYYKRIGRVRLDGSEQSIILESVGSSFWFTSNDSNLLYVTGGNLYEIDLKDNSERKVLELGKHMQYTRNIYQNKFYYTTLDDSFFDSRLTLHSFDMKTHETTKITMPRNWQRQSLPQFSDYIIGDKIFRTYSKIFMMMDLDGKNIQRFPPQTNLTLRPDTNLIAALTTYTPFGINSHWLVVRGYRV